MSFGKTIKLFRTAKNLTQVEVASFLNITPEYISKIENDSKTPSMLLLSKFSQLFDIPLQLLLFSSLTEKDLPKSKRKNFKIIKPILKDLLDLLLDDEFDDFNEISILLKKLKSIREESKIDFGKKIA